MFKRNITILVSCGIIQKILRDLTVDTINYVFYYFLYTMKRSKYLVSLEVSYTINDKPIHTVLRYVGYWY